jgi:hypothetical protein
MKLITTIRIEQEITEEQMESDFEASTIDEAVANQQSWIEDGSIDIYDLIDGPLTITVSYEE